MIECVFGNCVLLHSISAGFVAPLVHHGCCPPERTGRWGVRSREPSMKLDRRRLLSGIAVAGLAILAAPVVARADDDDDNGDEYRSGGGYRNNHENRPNGNPSGNN